MVLQKRYTLSGFGAIAYLLAVPSGKEFVSKWNFFDQFEYKLGEVPLSALPWPPIVCVAYLISVYLLSRYMKNKEAWNLHSFRIIHNAILCFGSFMMVVGMLNSLANIYHQGGTEALVCDENGLQMKGNLFSWYYIFYLSKFYEFIDTYILILRKKPLTFLHVFHHFITALLCWLGLYDGTAMQWTVIVMNGSVHVFMYYYYLAMSFNSEIWWKKYLTTMQITQFCADLVLCLPYYYYDIVLGKNCAGTSLVLGISNAVLISFLILFINFFQKTYTAPKNASHVKAN